jgi:C4-dicarboxylate-specific signal transduction histidine kinase
LVLRRGLGGAERLRLAIPLVRVAGRGVPFAITHTTVVSADLDSLAAANRHAVYGQVARWLIHDLRNPAQALTLITELMGEAPEPGDPGTVETIREATAQLSRSLELLDRLFRLPRPTVEAAPLSLRDSLEFVEALHRSHRSGMRLDLEGALGSILPAVAGVEHEIEQILLNLVLNALEATEEAAGSRLVVNAIALDGIVRISVSDNGPGVPPDRRPRVFIPVPTVRGGRLRGLGLAVSRGLARRFGGDLILSAEADPGTRFDLLLPAWSRG